MLEISRVDCSCYANEYGLEAINDVMMKFRFSLCKTVMQCLKM